MLLDQNIDYMTVLYKFPCKWKNLPATTTIVPMTAMKLITKKPLVAMLFPSMSRPAPSNIEPVLSNSCKPPTKRGAVPFQEVCAGELLPMKGRLPLQGGMQRESREGSNAHAGQASKMSALALNHSTSHLSHEGMWQNFRVLKDVPASNQIRQHTLKL